MSLKSYSHNLLLLQSQRFERKCKMYEKYSFRSEQKKKKKERKSTLIHTIRPRQKKIPDELYRFYFAFSSHIHLFMSALFYIYSFL
jgi:hypothetical protein